MCWNGSAVLTSSPLAARVAVLFWRALLPVGLAAALGVIWPSHVAYADEVRDRQWQLGQLRVRDAWEHATGDNVVVAVVDSGVDADHPDLSGRVLPGVDYVKPGGDGHTDEVGHGTAVAALIAGDDDASGVAGIAPQAKILPVRVLDRENRYENDATVAKGIRWAVDHGAHVVNLSLGSANRSTSVAEAIQYAYDHDVVVVACGGNVGVEKTDQIWYPASEPGVIAVTGVDQNGKFWKSSLHGPQSVLSAPATNLVGARPGGYWKIQGTSFAAPLVSGVAALVRSYWPDMNAGNVVNRLIRTARDQGPRGRDDRYGFGVVDPVGALTNPVASVKKNPLDITPPSRRPSPAWKSSPRAKQVIESDDSGVWWWVGFTGLGGAAGMVAVTVVVLRRRRTPAAPAVPMPPTTWPPGR